jgi:hypothetical protein
MLSAVELAIALLYVFTLPCLKPYWDEGRLVEKGTPLRAGKRPEGLLQPRL